MKKKKNYVKNFSSLNLNRNRMVMKEGISIFMILQLQLILKNNIHITCWPETRSVPETNQLEFLRVSILQVQHALSHNSDL